MIVDKCGIAICFLRRTKMAKNVAKRTKHGATQNECIGPSRMGHCNVESIDLDPTMPILEPAEPNVVLNHLIVDPQPICLSDSSVIDEADREVEYATRKHKRRKSYGWSKHKSSRGSRSRSRSRSRSTTFSEVSRTTHASGTTFLSGFTTDYSDAEGLLIEHGVRTDDEVRDITSRRRRRRRGHGWSRQKGSRSSRRSRSRSRNTNYSRASKKTVVSSVSRADTITKKLIMQTRSRSVRLKNMFNDILAVKGNLRDFTTAYLIQEKACYEFYHSDDENQTIPIVKTRIACKIRDEVLQAYKSSVFECTECCECFLEPRSATQHMIEEHNSMTLYICEQCLMKFVAQAHYDIHKETHDKVFKGYCLFCSQEFTHRKKYEEHMDNYLTNSYKCWYCGDIYLDKYKFKRHVRMQHPGKKFHIKQPLSCIICRVDYNKPESYRNNQSGSEFVVRILTQKSVPETNDCDLHEKNIQR